MSDVLFADDLFTRTPDSDIAALIAPPAPDAPLPPGWPVGGIGPHPFASINRMMTADEARELRADIGANGLKRRIVMFENRILDGRNRYLECVGLGLFAANVDWRTDPHFVEFGGKGWDLDEGSDALSFVWSMEVRRHRSARDTALAAARYLKFIALLKPDDPDAATAKLRLPSQADMAKRYGISERLIHSAMTLLDRAEPELVKAVEAGTVSLTDGADVARFAPEAQVEVAQAPTRKAAKQKVKAAKKAAPKAPNLPDPLSRTALMAFAESVLLKANVAVLKQDKTGKFLSAEIVLDLGREHGIIEKSGAMAWTRPALLAMGKLREEAKPASGRKADRHPSSTKTERLALDGRPIAPPLGGEHAISVGGLNAKHSASLAVFHEADDTFSISVNFKFANSGRGSPFAGSYPSFEAALSAAGVELVTAFSQIAGSTDSVTTEAEKASAYDGQTWLEKRFAAWQLPRPEPVANQTQSSGVTSENVGEGADVHPDALPGVGTALVEYERLLEGATHLKGKHTRATAEPIIRAADQAEIKVQQVADDIGHPKGTVGGWRNKLGLQDHDRLHDPARVEHFKGRPSEASA